MKKIILVIAILLSVQLVAQETKIPFKRGVVKLCSAKDMNISGYDGDDVVIRTKSNYNKLGVTTGYSRFPDSTRKPAIGYLASRPDKFQKRTKGLTTRSYPAPTDSAAVTIYGALAKFESADKSKGLKSLAEPRKEEHHHNLSIEEKNGELIIKDAETDSYYVFGQQYEILIPNSVKLVWNTGSCVKPKTFFVTSRPWKLSDFKGEVEVSTSHGALLFEDVTGPVTATTVGGDITVKFTNSKPSKLYSLISNNGDIDISLSESSDIEFSTYSEEIFSDIEFEILENKNSEKNTTTRLKLNKGTVKFKLSTDYGGVYLRKN